MSTSGAFCVVLEGRIADGFARADVINAFARLTGQPVERAEQLLSGGPVIVKRNIDQDTAGRFARALTKIGVVCRLESGSPYPIEPEPTAAGSTNASSSAPRRPIGASKRGLLSDQDLYRAIIGPRNTQYYLDYFKDRDDGGSLASWNWAAFFLLPWALYRKLWGFFLGGVPLVFLVALVLGFLVGVLGAYGGVDSKTIESWGYAVGVLATALLGVFANAYYYRKARRLIRATAHFTDPETRRAELARRGGTSLAWLWFFVAPMTVAILVAIAIPAYRDYKARVSSSIQASSVEARPPDQTTDATRFDNVNPGTALVRQEARPSQSAGTSLPVNPSEGVDASSIQPLANPSVVQQVADPFFREPVIFARTASGYLWQSPRLGPIALGLSSQSPSYQDVKAAAIRKYPYLETNERIAESLMQWYLSIALVGEPAGVELQPNAVAMLYAVMLVVDAKENGNVVCWPDHIDIYPEPKKSEAIQLLRARPGNAGWGRRCDPL